MTNEIFEYYRQARGPRNYLLLGLSLAIIYIAARQGWGLAGTLLCGPFLGMVLVRLIANDAAGFRMSPAGLAWFDGTADGEIGWNRVRAVAVAGDGAGGALCDLHLANGFSMRLPATAAFAPERLAQEFRARGISVWRPASDTARTALAA